MKHRSCTRSEHILKEIQSIYGLPQYNAFRILEATLNLREIKVYNGVAYDHRATIAALEKQKLIQEAFASGVGQDEDRRWGIEEAYNRMFEDCDVKHYDGKMHDFSGMNESIIFRLVYYEKNVKAIKVNFCYKIFLNIRLD